MAKTTPWNKIKKEYLEGATPKELGEKYGLTAKQISDKANHHKWVEEKTRISENVREKTQEQVEKLTTLALSTLEDALRDADTKPVDKVPAVKAVIDISGLKNQTIDTKIKNIIVQSQDDKDLLESI